MLTVSLIAGGRFLGVTTYLLQVLAPVPPVEKMNSLGPCPTDISQILQRGSKTILIV